jgi:hypothetical protein
VSAEPVAPQNLAAEESVLGALMLAGTYGPEASASVVAAVLATGLTAGDFYRDSHTLVYEAALAVAERGEPTDVLAVERELRARRKLTAAGGSARLVELAALVPATANAAHYARLVVDAGLRRVQAALGRALVDDARNGSLDPKLHERVGQWLGSRRAGVGAPGTEHSWYARDLIELGSEPPQPPEIGGLFYRGKRHVLSGEDDAVKTMLLLGISADELRAEHGVVWIDTDDMGASGVLERLHAFGADDEEIRRRFAYLHPEEAICDAARAHVLALVRELDARLLVNDAFNAPLALHGYNPKATEEVEAFWQRVVAPFCHAGVAFVLPDHVVKEKEARGRYAYGSERKATGSDVHLGLRVIEPFGRGRRGKAKITVHRDRVGFIEKPSPGLFVLDSDVETGRLAWQLEASRAVGGEGEFRPTGYMEKVSLALEKRIDDPPPRDWIEQNVKGGAKWIRQAIDALLSEEYAVEIPGERGARLVKFLRPFREADEWADS